MTDWRIDGPTLFAGLNICLCSVVNIIVSVSWNAIIHFPSKPSPVWKLLRALLTRPPPSIQCCILSTRKTVRRLRKGVPEKPSRWREWRLPVYVPCSRTDLSSVYLATVDSIGWFWWHRDWGTRKIWAIMQWDLFLPKIIVLPRHSGPRSPLNNIYKRWFGLLRSVLVGWYARCYRLMSISSWASRKFPLGIVRQHSKYARRAEEEKVHKDDAEKSWIRNPYPSRR